VKTSLEQHFKKVIGPQIPGSLATKTLHPNHNPFALPRNKKYWKNRFGYLSDKPEPYPNHIDLRNIDDLDDEGFAYYMANIKGVSMLDLNETELTDESIHLLTKLEYVTELRAKDISGLTDACADDLNQIKGLEFLHVKNTEITIDGLLKLKDQRQLKTILFSATDVNAIKEKLLQLKAMHPACELVIDGKPYYFDNIEQLIYAVKTQPYTYNLKIKNESPAAAWSNWIIKPTENYFETAMQGPYSVTNIEWIEVNPLENRKEGRLMPEKIVDHTDSISHLLEVLAIPYMIVDGIIRLYIV